MGLRGNTKIVQIQDRAGWYHQFKVQDITSIEIHNLYDGKEVCRITYWVLQEPDCSFYTKAPPEGVIKQIYDL